MKKLATTVLVIWSALVCAAFAPFYVPAISVVPRTAAVSGLASPLIFQNNGAGGASYSYVHGGGQASYGSTDVTSVIPTDGVLSDLYVRHTNNGVTTTLYLNGVATALTCTTSSNVCSETSATVPVVAGDLVYMANGNPSGGRTGVKFTATGQYQPIISNIQAVITASYNSVGGVSDTGSSSGSNIIRAVMPTAGTFDKLYVRYVYASTTGSITLYVNNVATSLTCSVASASSCNELSASVSVSAGDMISWRSTASSSNGRASISMRFSPTVSGEAILLNGQTGSQVPPTFTTGYSTITSPYGTTEYGNIIPYAANLKKLFTYIATAPSSGKSRAFTFRKGVTTFSDTSLTCTIANTAVDCSDTSNVVAITAGESINLKSVPSGSPPSSNSTGFSAVITQ